MVNKVSSMKKYMIYGTIAINLLATLNHFLYELSGDNTIVGIFMPINESVWEHLKLAFYPTLVWWVLGYFLYRNKLNIHKGKYISAMIISLMISPVIVVNFYYTYTGALGIQSMILDIFSLLLGVFVAQSVAVNYYEKCEYSTIVFLVLVIIGVMYAALLTYVTFYPPNLPIFIDSTNGLRGIYKIK